MNCNHNTITQYTGYSMNVYNYLSIDKIKKGKRGCMDGSDRIASMFYIKKDIISLSTYYVIKGK